MSEGIKGTIPCELFGGPLDGRTYGDLPDTGNAYTNSELSMPLEQPADASPRAIYVCLGEASVNGRWQFFYERTENPAPPARHAERWDAGIQAALARAIATIAHKGQTDKTGAPYITHAARVASRFDPVVQPLEHCAAWLHDVVEDTGLTADDLRAAGIHGDIADVVLLLTRRSDMASEDYYRRIITNAAAVAVKAADIGDNTSPARTRLLDDETRERLAVKYDAARRTLGLREGTF